jgi:hypothetical protein
MIRHLTATAGRLVRAQGLAVLALIILISGGTAAYAATVAKNSVVSRSIKDGQVKTVDLKTGGVTSLKVADDTLTGSDIDESSLGTVPDASSLGGLPASSYLRGSAYKKESALQVGTDKGDGTFVIASQCDPGDMILSGGPANVNATSDMVESFPAPGIINGWQVRIHKNAAADTFSVVMLCLNTA